MMIEPLQGEVKTQQPNISVGTNWQVQNEK